MNKDTKRSAPSAASAARAATETILKETVAFLHAEQSAHCAAWAKRIQEASLLKGMTREGIASEVAAFYDTYVGALDSGILLAVEQYARDLSRRTIPFGVQTHEMLSLLLLLRELVVRVTLDHFQHAPGWPASLLAALEPSLHRVTTAAAQSFIQERERIVRQQQEANAELPTPILPAHEGLVILPLVGAVDGRRVRHLTERLLRSIRENRAKVVVVDITGVAILEGPDAGCLFQALDASRLMGARVILTGVSHEIAQTLGNAGLDVSKLNILGDLQDGLQEAYRWLGYQWIKTDAALK
jgi:rsbT co-antagonist protein RsbR